MSHNTKSNEEIKAEALRQAEARGWTAPNLAYVIDEILALKDTEKEQAVQEIIKMADALELECGLDGDKGTKQWMAFKGFRNSIRDRFLTPLPKNNQ